MGDGVLAVFADKVIDNKTVDFAIQAVGAGKCILIKEQQPSNWLLLLLKYTKSKIIDGIPILHTGWH